MGKKTLRGFGEMLKEEYQEGLLWANIVGRKT